MTVVGRLTMGCGLLLAAACSKTTPSPRPDDQSLGNALPSAVAESALIDDTVAMDAPYVVGIGIRQAFSGGNLLATCTGVVIGPRVIATARHCLEPQRPGETAIEPPTFEVRQGVLLDKPTSVTPVASFRVPAKPLRDLPGSPLPYQGVDVGVLILAEEDAIDIKPVLLSTLAPKDLGGQNVTLYGYGLDDDDVVPQKEQGVAVVGPIANDAFLLTAPHVCFGDSGGPVLDDEGELVGIISAMDRTPDSNCGTVITAIASTGPLFGFFREALRDTSGCSDVANVDLERCDGYDDDCDSVVDEGCALPGTACGVGCAGGARCENGVCHLACAPDGVMDGAFDGLAVCPSGTICTRSQGSCFVGRCAPAGTSADGSACNQAADCVSGSCVLEGDGASRCRAPCQGEASTCPNGQKCARAGDGCGICVDITPGGGAVGFDLPNGPGPSPIPPGIFFAFAAAMIAGATHLGTRRGRRRVLSVALGVAAVGCGGSSESSSPGPQDDVASMDTVITDVVEDASVLDVPTTPDIASLDGGGDGDASSDYRRPTLERLEANPGCYSNQVSTAFDGETDFVVAQRIDTPSLPARVHAMTMWTASLSPGTVKPSIALGLCDTELPIPLVVFAGPPSADGRGVESISAFAEIIAPPDGIDADQRIQVLVWPPLTVQEGEVLYVGGRYAVEDDRASCFTICAEGAEGIVARVDADGTFEWLSTHGPLDVDATLELLAP